MATALLTVEALAELLCISVHTLNNWRCQKRGPKFIRLGGLVRYRESDVNRWLESQTEEMNADQRAQRTVVGGVQSLRWRGSVLRAQLRFVPDR